ncbi:hypothetical protein [Paenibacillus sp. FSL W7-1332]|uniref:hypothetical protein n=1 Tax=Paenibacillus sp. FSL W7-1332 TaxID=2921702 RepID=UPI0030CC74F1
MVRLASLGAVWQQGVIPQEQTTRWTGGHDFKNCSPVPPTERPSDVKPSSFAGFIIHPGFPATHNVVTNGNPKTSAIVQRFY